MAKKSSRKSIMNLPNKITIARIILSLVIVVILALPENLFSFLPKFFIDEKLVVDSKILIVGVLFIVASLTDYIDGYIARSRNLVTDFGKMMDAIADKMLVNSVLILLAAKGFVHPIVPVIVILRDSVVNSIKMIAASKGRVVAAIKSGKIKTACLMIGISLTLFYNLPFELWNIKISDIFLFVATIMSLISCVQYYTMNKSLIFED